jgi:hypothetical protein
MSHPLAFSRSLRPLAPDEREWLGRETVVIRERIAETDRRHVHTSVAAARAMCLFALLFACLAAFNWWWQASTTMLISLGATLLLLALAAWLRWAPIPHSLAEARRLETLESARARGEVVTVHIHADAVLDLRSRAGDHLGLLLRAADRVIYVRHDLLEQFAGDVVAERIPSELTVVSIVPLGVQTIAGGGALLEPVVEIVSDEVCLSWVEPASLISVSPATGERIRIDLETGQTEPVIHEGFDDGLLELVRALMAQPSATTPAGSE